ncbi:MAG: tyrosine-type recombinase/integrase [Candidatus Binataceae bacterium]|nr:tyrosine-type recombinase/integrase [Candidatus Binataceae bacterium]
MRGMGRIFKRGPVYWIAYSYRGKEHRESARSESESQARKLLKKRIGETSAGTFIGPNEERLTFEGMAGMLLIDYQINGKRSVATLRGLIRHLSVSFGMTKAVDITADRIAAYIAHRQREGAANASINRELAALKRMFNLAVRARKLNHAPYIAMLSENNARQGFVDHPGFLAVRDALPAHLKDPITFLYFSGWRAGEMKALEWRDVDLDGKVVRLRPEVSKNKAGRVLPLAGELLEVVEQARAKRRPDCKFVFHDDGQPIGSFRKAWRTACKAAGQNEILVHDLRRTAIRNMVRAGVPDRIAMALSGHKTRSIFDRYNIVSESDLVAASERLQAHLSAQIAELPRVKPLKPVRGKRAQP